MIYLMLGELGKNPSLRWDLDPQPSVKKHDGHLST